MAPAPREPRYSPEDIAAIEEAERELDSIGLDAEGEFFTSGDLTSNEDEAPTD